jgi:hypothetical protein
MDFSDPDPTLSTSLASFIALLSWFPYRIHIVLYQIFLSATDIIPFIIPYRYVQSTKLKKEVFRYIPPRIIFGKHSALIVRRPGQMGLNTKIPFNGKKGLREWTGE